MHMSPFERMSASVEVAPVSVGAATTNGTGVDMVGWDGVAFIGIKGVGDRTFDMKAQSDTASNFGTAADITSAAITQIAGGTTGKGAILDVYRPTNRYVRAVLTTAGGSTGTLIAALAIRYRGTGRFPLTLDTTIATLTKLAQN